MAALSRLTHGMLRCIVSLRGAFVCALLVLLVAGAASYTHGSRYALVGHGPFLAAAGQSTDLNGQAAAPRSAATVAAPGDAPPSESRAVAVVQQASSCTDPESLERDCCGRRHAPRCEPAPLRTGAVDPPATLRRDDGDEVLGHGMPGEPDLPSLTVIQLSVSRT